MKYCVSIREEIIKIAFVEAENSKNAKMKAVEEYKKREGNMVETQHILEAIVMNRAQEVAY